MEAIAPTSAGLKRKKSYNFSMARTSLIVWNGQDHCWQRRNCSPPPVADPQPKSAPPLRRYYATEFVQRMLDESEIPREFAEPIELDSKYWIARRYCGWNALSVNFRDIGPAADGSRMLSDPVFTEFWMWFTRLPYHQIDDLVDLSLVSACDGCQHISAGYSGGKMSKLEKRSKATLADFANVGSFKV